MNVRSLSLVLIAGMLGATPLLADDKPAGAPAPQDRIILLDLEEVKPQIKGDFTMPLEHRLLLAPDQGGRKMLFIQGPAGGEGKPHTMTIKALPMRKVTHLGVATSPVAPQVAAQLNLPEGFGLTVDVVEPDSPADKAGLKQHDVIVRLGDQKVVNMAQLGTLVRAHKPGDTIELTIIRQSKEQVLKAELVEKEKAVIADAQWNAARALEGPFNAELAPHWQRALINPRGQRVLKFADDDHVLTLTMDNEGKKLTVHDKAGKELFEGPINTDEERAKVPDAVKPKLQKLEKSVESRQLLLPGGGAGIVPGGNVELELDFDDKQLGDLIQRHMKQFPEGGIDHEAMKQKIQEMQKQIQTLMQQQMKEFQQNGFAPGAAGQRMNLNVNGAVASAVFSDGQHTLTIKTEDGKKHLNAKDRDGNVLFDGPINTDEERAKVPDELRGKLKMLESHRIEIRQHRLERPRQDPPPRPRLDDERANRPF